MKSRFWKLFSILVLIFVMILFCYFWLRQKADMDMKANANHLSAESNKVEDVVADDSKSNSVFHSHGSGSRRENTINDRLEALKKALVTKNVPISFYGRIIDQSGNPLAGVHIGFYIRHWELKADSESKPIRLERSSDFDGRFEVSGVSGDGGSIEYVNKDMYELEPTQMSFGASSGTTSNPVIFRMWGTNIHEQLISGDIFFDIKPDGTKNLIDLAKGIITDSGEADICIWVKYQAQPSNEQIYDWSCQISTVNGGLLEPDNFNSPMYVAPESGYKTSFEYQQQIKAGQHGTTGERKFFVLLKNGTEYGRINIEIMAPYNRSIPCRIRMQFSINPTGSRILR